jgi:hypothetical protein
MLLHLRLLLPLSLIVPACSFFTVEDAPSSDQGASASGGTGAMGGTGGATGGVGGATGGVGGGTGGVSGSGAVGGATGGAAGDVAGAGVGGATSGSAGDVGLGGNAGVAGDASGGAGIGGDAGLGGSAGSAGNAGGGSVTCATLSGQAYEGHCYLFNSGSATWQNARAACEAHSPGGHLVTITSQGEQDFVWGVALMTEAWIGATDGLGDTEPGTGAPSTWITSEDIGQYDGWADGEPNNYMKTCPSGSGECYEHCGFLQASTNGAWNDDVCGAERPYLCEWDSGG